MNILEKILLYIYGFIHFCNEDGYLWGNEMILCLPLNQGLIWQASAQYM